MSPAEYCGLTPPQAFDPHELERRLAAKGMALGKQLLFRIFKSEGQLEVWMDAGNRFELFASYPICNWSGDVGPKLKEGDKQAPEGFYIVTARQMNPNSEYYLSFNIGFPNAYDRANNYTGSFLMVHGGCASVGCFAMTDGVVDEIWRIVTAAFQAGQKRFHVHVFPFRLSEENLTRRAYHPSAGFWRDLKAGYDSFEATQLVPRIGVCAGRYIVTQATGPGDGGHEIANSCINLTDNKG